MSEASSLAVKWGVEPKADGCTLLNIPDSLHVQHLFGRTQGYLAHNKTPPPLGAPDVPRHMLL